MQRIPVDGALCRPLDAVLDVDASDHIALPLESHLNLCLGYPFRADPDVNPIKRLGLSVLGNR